MFKLNLRQIGALTYLAFCYGLMMNAARADTNQPAAKIVFASTNFDFGKIVCGKVVKHDFVFTNTGGQVLQISQAKSSCGCAVINTWSRQVEPGKTGQIPVEIHSQNLDGQVNKEVVVSSNDPIQPVVRLQVTGNVWKPIEVQPANAVFNLDSDDPTNLVRVVRIINKTEEPLSLSALESNQPLLTALLQTNQPGKEYQVEIHLSPPKSSGNVFGQVKLKTSLAQMPEITIPAWALAPMAVSVSPSALLLPPGALPEKLVKVIFIRGGWEKPLRISNERINVQGVDVQLKELQPGRYYSLTATFPVGFQLKQGEKVELSVKSNHPQYPEIKIPVLPLNRP